MYNQVYVSNEEDGFRILLGNSMGTLGNAMMPSESKFHQNGSRFTTIDKDQDEFPENCAVRFGGGGWWYKICYKAQLTGQYGTTDWAWPWYPTFTDGTAIKTVKMMLRRKAL
ncbi:fibrinogen-like protein A [Saccostrea cucullata]|uniref:fibrinogen-like protein A n=1 Tax=Saccostrea cuccullata TaxID=36930 RepID=UPI002ECFF81E